jgi:hypothetical protein
MTFTPYIFNAKQVITEETGVLLPMSDTRSLPKREHRSTKYTNTLMYIEQLGRDKVSEFFQAFGYAPKLSIFLSWFQ